MSQYPIHPLEQLDNEQLDDLLGEDWKATSEDMFHIHANLSEQIHRRKPRRQIAVIALVALLSVSLVGFANADRIQTLFGRYFGSQQISKYASNVTDSSTGNGFTLKAITAIREESNTYLFMELTGEDGKYLSDDLDISYCNVEGISKDLGDNVASMYGIGCKLIEYDDRTNTATIVAHLTGDFQEEQAVFTLRSFATGKREVASPLELNLSDVASGAQPSFMSFEDIKKNLGGYGYGDEFEQRNMRKEDIRCLNIGDLHVTFTEYDLVEVTNIGYQDGLLHIQTRTRTLLPGNQTYPELRDQAGNQLGQLYEVSFGLIDSGMGVAASEYTEYVYEIGDIENLKNYTFGIYGHYYQNAYGGEWQIKMNVPENIQTTEIDLSRAIMTEQGEFFIQKVAITPISVTIVFDTAIESEPNVSVTYNDGATAVLEADSMFTYEDGKQERRYTGAVIDMEKLASIKVNGESIAVK